MDLLGQLFEVTWLDCRSLDLSDEPAAVFLERGRAALNSGSAFGSGGQGHVRLNLATSPESVTEAVRRNGPSGVKGAIPPIGRTCGPARQPRETRGQSSFSGPIGTRPNVLPRLRGVCAPRTVAESTTR